MTKDLWLNLPVKDVARSKAFFSELGFGFKEPNPAGPGSACMTVGTKPIIVMLFEEAIFAGFTQHAVSDTSKATQVLLSIDAESPAEVDALASAAKRAGGQVFAPPASFGGFMYGCGFADLDGHRWNVLHMDMSQRPKA